MHPGHDAARESDEEDDEDEEDVLALPPVTCMRTRGSVSAEAYGEWNRLTVFEPPVSFKSDEHIAELTRVLKRSFLFEALDPRGMNSVVLAMKGPFVVEPGHTIIKEGDPGDHLYVVTDGVMDCYKLLGGQNSLVKTCSKGDLFGELALLYNCPRAASVVCSETATLWELDRETFTNIVMVAVLRKRETCTAVLRRIPWMATLTEAELNNIVDALKVESHLEGSVIIRQGEFGDHFFIVQDGQVVASKEVPGNPEPIIFHHEAGDYFGELALLRDEPRAASVVAKTEVRLLSMDRATFKRLMGPAEEFLQRGAARYD